MKIRTYILLVMATVLLGCKSQKPVVVATHNDSVSVTQRDSIASIRAELELTNLERILDSVSTEVWHRELMRGDSVVAKQDSTVTIRTIYRDRYIDRNKEVHDTIRLHVHDTSYLYKEIPVEVPVTVEVPVEKPGSQFLRNSGIALWVLIGLAILAAIAGIVLKFAK